MQVTGTTSHADVVSFLWTNLTGSTSGAAQAASVVALPDVGLSVGVFTTLAANLAFNTEHINLGGWRRAGWSSTTDFKPASPSVEQLRRDSVNQNARWSTA